MAWCGQIRRRIAVLLNRDRFADDLAEEMAAHVALEAAENRERGMTVVMVTHDMALARQAQRVLRLQDGSIQAPKPVPHP